MTRRLARGAAVLVTVVAIGLVSASCTSPRNALGTNSSRCFRALAVAKEAVGGKGRYAGVRYISSAAFITDVKHHQGKNTNFLPKALLGSRDALCAVNYLGSFSSSSVHGGWPPGRTGGQFAVVAVDARTNAVLGTLVLDHAPLRFSKFLI